MPCVESKYAGLNTTILDLQVSSYLCIISAAQDLRVCYDVCPVSAPCHACAASLGPDWKYNLQILETQTCTLCLVSMSAYLPCTGAGTKSTSGDSSPHGNSRPCPDPPIPSLMDFHGYPSVTNYCTIW